MRDLKRNRRKIYYSNYDPNANVTDQWGNESMGAYTDPVLMCLTVVPTGGSATDAGFGKDVSYSMVLLTHDRKCPIDEYSRLWISNDPKKGEPHDYIVKRMQRNLNFVQYAIDRVNADGS